MRIARLVDDAVLKWRSAGEDQELAVPGVLGFEQHQQVLLGYGKATGQIGVGEKFSRQGVDAGTLGCRADDFDLEPFFECSLRIDFEGAGGDEIEPAARWHGEALHIVKSGQDADVERRDDFAYACVA